MKNILITTGGSGGHVIPALSIYDHLNTKFNITLTTDGRGAKFISKKNYSYNLIDVPNLFSKLYLFPINLIKFFLSIVKSYFFLKKKNIHFLISTGGYMSLPLCISSKFLNIEIYLLEPNSVLGRANKFMLSISNKIICYDKDLKSFPKKFLKKIYILNPILRKEIYLHNKNQLEKIPEIKKIIIIGGSQGAKFFDKSITNLMLEISNKIKIEVNQQVFSKEEKIKIDEKYNKAGINYNLFDYDNNLFKNLNKYDLAITRSGASAIAELAFYNIPFIAIPFPFAKDDHQYFNAEYYEKRECCWIIRQEKFDIKQTSDFIIQLFDKKINYFEKKRNLANITNQNTWNNINKKLMEIFNEN